MTQARTRRPPSERDHALRYPWVPMPFSVGSMPHTRSADLLEAVVAQFELPTSPRYQPRDGKTYCNIAAWDITRALYAEVPHWCGPDGRPCRPGTPGAIETTANNLARWWFRDIGQVIGWTQVSADDAQAHADAGRPAVASLENQRGHGHIAVLVPSRGEAGVWIAQAGARCFARGRLAEGFGQHSPEFWTHP